MYVYGLLCQKRHICSFVSFENSRKYREFYVHVYMDVLVIMFSVHSTKRNSKPHSQEIC